MKVTVKLQTFEGPLDLLLHLIDKAEVDIYDIPIKTVTDQYMEYLDAMQELELEVTSEFLVMAATLLSIKSKMLLPKPPVLELDFDDYMADEDYDPRAELVAKLVEYRKYKAIADHLRDKEVERSRLYTREPEDLTPYVPVTQDSPLKGLHIGDLVRAFQKAVHRMKNRELVTKIRKDEISVKDRMFEMLDTLERHGGKMFFFRLIGETASRDTVVVTFLAMLELMKVKKIVCFQHELFDDIVIEARKDGASHGVWPDEIHY